MAVRKIAVTVDELLLQDIDDWVARGEYPSRSRVVQTALTQLRSEHEGKNQLVHELAKLDPQEERNLAEEALKADEPWPEY